MGKMVPDNLVKTVARFNEFCKAGKDADFDRKPGTLAPVDKPPFYALPLYAGGPNTKGGIDCNARREVLDWAGKPIPRLFTAGEISSALKFVYQGGGNLTECIVMKGCHDEEKLAMKSAEKFGRQNPHDNRLGAIACGECHRAHKPSVDTCAKCHQFGFKVP